MRVVLHIVAIEKFAFYRHGHVLGKRQLDFQAVQRVLERGHSVQTPDATVSGQHARHEIVCGLRHDAHDKRIASKIVAGACVTSNKRIQ